MPGDGRGARILIVSAGMGAGHNEVSAELARRLQAAGTEPQVVDLLRLAGGPGRRLERTYRGLLRAAPWLYDGAMRVWARNPPVMERLTAAGAGPFERALVRAVETAEPDLVVATYNLAAQCLGRLRLQGRVSAPLVTVVIDPGPHPYWVSPGATAHLVPTDATAAALRGYGAVDVRRCAPVLRPEFADPPDRATARRYLGLSGTEHIALLNAGSWAAGRIRSTVDVVATTPDVTTMVLCGRNDGLARELADRRGVRAVPWTTDMAAYLAASDVVVDNAGGLTCWEALACATPVTLFRPLPGHGRINASTLESMGLATRSRTEADLRRAVRPRPAPAVDEVFGAPDAAALIRDLVPDTGNRHAGV